MFLKSLCFSVTKYDEYYIKFLLSLMQYISVCFFIIMILYLHRDTKVLSGSHSKFKCRIMCHKKLTIMNSGQSINLVVIHVIGL